MFACVSVPENRHAHRRKGWRCYAPRVRNCATVETATCTWDVFKAQGPLLFPERVLGLRVLKVLPNCLESYESATVQERSARPGAERIIAIIEVDVALGVKGAVQDDVGLGLTVSPPRQGDDSFAVPLQFDERGAAIVDWLSGPLLPWAVQRSAAGIRRAILEPGRDGPLIPSSLRLKDDRMHVL